MKLDGAPLSSSRVRRPQFRKCFVVLFAVVIVPLLASGASEAWFGYRDQIQGADPRHDTPDTGVQSATVDQRAEAIHHGMARLLRLLPDSASPHEPRSVDPRANLSLRLRAEARLAAARIQAFLDQVRSQLEWTVQLPWAEGADERHRFDVLRLMRQAPAITAVTLVDGNGVERLRVSRTDPDVAMREVDHSTDPAVIGAPASHIWFGPLTLHRGSEPFMTVAMAGSRSSAGVTIAEINLKLKEQYLRKISRPAATSSSQLK